MTAFCVPKLIRISCDVCQTQHLHMMQQQAMVLCEYYVTGRCDDATNLNVRRRSEGAAPNRHDWWEAESSTPGGSLKIRAALQCASLAESDLVGGTHCVPPVANALCSAQPASWLPHRGTVVFLCQRFKAEELRYFFVWWTKRSLAGGQKDLVGHNGSPGGA